MNKQDLEYLSSPKPAPWRLPLALILMAWCAGEVLLNAWRAVWAVNGAPYMLWAIWYGVLFLGILVVAEHLVNKE